MAVSHYQTQHRKSHIYFKLESGHGPHGPQLELHLPRTAARELFLKLGKILAASKRGHRSWHCAVLFRGKAWTRITVETHNAHRRRAASKKERKH